MLGPGHAGQELIPGATKRSRIAGATALVNNYILPAIKKVFITSLFLSGTKIVCYERMVLILAGSSDHDWHVFG